MPRPTRVLGRLTVVQVVSAIGALFLAVVPVTMVAFIGRQLDEARVAGVEISGLPASAALLRLATLTAEHRDISNGLLAGDQAFRALRDRNQVKVDHAIVRALDATRSWNTPRIAGLRGVVRDEWAALSHAVAVQSVAAPDSFRRHSALVQSQLQLLDEIVSASTLALDPDPVAHHLVAAALESQPFLGELIGQLRGVGTGILARSTFELVDASLIITGLASRHRMLDTGMAKLQHAGAADPSVLVALGPDMERARSALARATTLIEADLRQADRPRMTASVFFATITEALDAQSALAEATFAILDARLRSRAHAARRNVVIVIGVGVVVLVLNSWLVLAIVRSIRRDINAREAERSAATRSSAFLSAALEAAPDSIVILDGSGVIELVNSHVERTFGYARHDLIGKPAHVLFPTAVLVDVAGVFAGRVANGHAIAEECSRKDGTRFPAELEVSPVDIAGTRHIVVVGRDVSERRAMERQIQHGQRMESIGQLTGGLAHDFNNLLGVVLGNLDLLERHVQTNDKAAARVRTAQRAALRGSELTKHLLAFARRQQLDPQPTQVNEMIGDFLEMLPRTLGPDITIATCLAEGMPSATVDASGLENTLLNLALNARDAMPDGGRLTIATTLAHLDDEYGAVQTGELAAGSYVRISISDTGHGMSPETIAKAFEPFFTTKPLGKGTGLGLAMVYGFVKQSRGNIGIYSEPGVGTTFTMYLPLADAGAPAHAAVTSLARALPPGGSVKGTVLVVDDEVDLLEVAVSFCEELGLRVLHATDGPSALEVAAGQPHIDLLLTDVVMPGGLNGVALAARLRARFPDLKVAYCSGFPSSALADRSQLRVDGPLINKPYLKSTFIRTVIEVLAAPATAHEEHAA